MRPKFVSRLSTLPDPKALAPLEMEARASRQVILSTRTFNSPQIIKLSGIGSTDELSRFGIKNSN